MNFDQLLKEFGYKKKGNCWKKETEEISKIIELQKSNFSNLYYLNYRYNFNKLDYQETKSHIFNRLGSSNQNENNLINTTLDLEYAMSDEERKQNIVTIVNDILMPKIERMNNESDVVRELKTRSHLNDIPLEVKAYLHL